MWTDTTLKVEHNSWFCLKKKKKKAVLDALKWNIITSLLSRNFSDLKYDDLKHIKIQGIIKISIGCKHHGCRSESDYLIFNDEPSGLIIFMCWNGPNKLMTWGENPRKD